MANNDVHSNQPSEAPGEITESSEPIFQNGQLSYLGRDIEVIPQQLIEDYCNITARLDLSYNRLQSLKGLQHFKFLKELVLDNNDLDDTVAFPHLKQLQTLTLNKNKLTDLVILLEQFCTAFPSLTYLSLLGNQACPNQLSSRDKDDEDYQRYRYNVLYKLPNLKFLDSTQVTLNEVSEAKRVGPYMKVVRPKDFDEMSPEGPGSGADFVSLHEDKVLWKRKIKDYEGGKQQDSKMSPSHSPGSKYTPLPSMSNDKNSEHQGFWGKSRSKYLGHNSEGNRFITDGIL